MFRQVSRTVFFSAAGAAVQSALQMDTSVKFTIGASDKKAVDVPTTNEKFWAGMKLGLEAELGATVNVTFVSPAPTDVDVAIHVTDFKEAQITNFTTKLSTPWATLFAAKGNLNTAIEKAVNSTNFSVTAVAALATPVLATATYLVTDELKVTVTGFSKTDLVHEANFATGLKNGLLAHVNKADGISPPMTLANIDATVESATEGVAKVIFQVGKVAYVAENTTQIDLVKGQFAKLAALKDELSTAVTTQEHGWTVTKVVEVTKTTTTSDAVSFNFASVVAILTVLCHLY